MSEEKMDEMITKAAASYNAPPAVVPKEEMWAAIMAARSPGPRLIYGSAPRRQSRFVATSTRVWLGAAAAALLVTAGAVVGRWSAPAAVAPQAVASTVRANPTVVEPGQAPPPVTPDLPAEGSAPRNGSRVIEPVTHVASNGSRSAGSNGRSASTGAAALAGRNATSAYQLATLTHLSDAEAMLTSFRSRTDEKMDAAMAKWARDLLTNTRLLLDSPAAADPRRRQLLEDLELTLVDIVQLSPGAGAQDRQMIEKNLDQGHVITRLRTAIPAGMQKGS